VLHVEGPIFEELHHVVVDGLRIRSNRKTVDSQKDVDHGKRHPFVAINEGMVLDEAFEQRGSLMDQRVVVAGLRPVQRGFEGARITDPRRAPVALNQLTMEKERIRR
jgi:hypothetical protein